MSEAGKRYKGYTEDAPPRPFDVGHFRARCAAQGALTREAQAELLGCVPNTVWRTETGRTRLTGDMAMEWARILGTTVERLHGQGDES